MSAEKKATKKAKGRMSRFMGVVLAAAVAIGTFGAGVGMWMKNDTQTAYADDLNNTVPNDETDEGIPFYSNEIHTYLGDNNYTAVHGPSYGPYGPNVEDQNNIVDGVYQSQSTQSATSFAAGLPLGTIFIDQSKIPEGGGITERVYQNEDILAGLEITSDNRVFYDGTKNGAILMVPNKINKLNGDLVKVTFEDAAVLPNGERADLVITYSNARIVVDERYNAMPDGTQYYEVKKWVSQVYESENPPELTLVEGETIDNLEGENMPVYKDTNGVKYAYKQEIIKNKTYDRYYKIYDVNYEPADPQPTNLRDTQKEQEYFGERMRSDPG